MKNNDIVKRVTDDFSKVYPHFKEFQQNKEYIPYWNKCIESVADRDFLICLIFCNDVFTIPPVKTFLTCYREYFVQILGDNQIQLDTFVKRGIGAFWGMVFKSILGYSKQESVSVSMSDFTVKTASVYSIQTEKQAIE